MNLRFDWEKHCFDHFFADKDFNEENLCLFIFSLKENFRQRFFKIILDFFYPSEIH